MASPGLEATLVAELASLGVKATEEPGGATFKATPQALATILVWSRCAGRVRVRLGEGPARSLDGLASGVRSLPWPEFARPRQPIVVDVVGSAGPRREGVSRKVENAIADALRVPGRWKGRPPGPLHVFLRLQKDVAEVSVDAAGGLLHLRGWRQATAKAPLRETHAAGLLRLAGWSPGEALVDPMCGSGTFPLEAARWAAGLSPREGWTYSASGWTDEHRTALQAAEKRRPRAVATPIWGSDRDDGAIKAARSNARRAQVDVTIRSLAFEEIEPPCPTGLLIANLPYGRRVGRPEAIRQRYEGWGRVIRERWGGWRVAMLVEDRELLSVLDRRLRPVTTFKHGGLSVVLGVREALG